MINKKVEDAANRLEDITLIAKTMCVELREGVENPYGRVYWLRRELGRIVASLGEGVPPGLDAIGEEYSQLISE